MANQHPDDTAKVDVEVAADVKENTLVQTAADGSKTVNVSVSDVAEAPKVTTDKDKLNGILDRIRDWMATEVRDRIPFPSATELSGLPDFVPQQYVERLSVVGSYVSYLQATLGRLESYYHTITDVYNLEMRHARQQVDKDELGSRPTNKAVEAAALAFSPELADIQNKQTTIRGCIDEVKSLIDAWKTIWDTVSRAVTVAQIEAGMSGSART